MIVLVKKELPAAEYYSLFCGDSILDLWNRIKADGLLDKYRSLFMLPQFEEQRIRMTEFNNSVSEGKISREDFSSYVFELDNCVYSCLGVATNEDEENALLDKYKDIFTTHPGIRDNSRSRYEAEFNELSAASSEERHKLLFGRGKTVLAFKR